MARRDRVPKTLTGKLHDLDDQVYLLRDQLRSLKEDRSHLKVIAAQLRVLVCFSSGTEGLLWRLVDELGVSDELELQLAFGTVNPNHPLNQGLSFWYIPIKRPGDGPPQLPIERVSLREVIKDHEVVYIAGKTKLIERAKHRHVARTSAATVVRTNPRLPRTE